MHQTVVTPKNSAYVGFAAMYCLAFFFYGFLATAPLALLGVPKGHWSYLAAYIAGMTAALVWIHRAVQGSLNKLHLSITNECLHLGRNPMTSISLKDISEVIPATAESGSFFNQKVKVSSIENFNGLLFRLKGGSYFSLMLHPQMDGIQPFISELLTRIRPQVNGAGQLSDHEAKVMKLSASNSIVNPAPDPSAVV